MSDWFWFSIVTVLFVRLFVLRRERDRAERVRIVATLGSHELPLAAIVTECKMPTYRVLAHLKLMAGYGLVRSRTVVPVADGLLSRVLWSVNDGITLATADTPSIRAYRTRA